ncbi:hypothetical protein JYT88_00105 [Rhodospirillaceae bacterium AH-315-P19]|nr:hypothetical protein [Rhodospirillaceae bacterium AH-315-P19]
MMQLTPTCQELDAFLVDYLEGNLPIYRRLIFFLHLRLCSKCRAYLCSYRELIASSKNAYSETAERLEMPQELKRAILASRKKNT